MVQYLSFKERGCKFYIMILYDFSFQDSSSANTTLEDFRKRLRQHQVLSQSRQGILILLPQTDEIVRHMGTDPIPQSISTQTNGMMPSSGNNMLPSSGPNVLNVPGGTQLVTMERPSNVCAEYEHDEPVRDNEDAQKQKMSQMDARTPVSHSRIRDRKHLMACPHIERTHAPEKGQSSSIAPHWHLACDIIPCEQSDPHVHVENVVQIHDNDRYAGVDDINGGTTRLHHHDVKGGVPYQRVKQDHAGCINKTRKESTDKLQNVDKHRPEILDRHELEGGQRQDGFVPQDKLDGHPRQRLDFENVGDESPRTPPQRLAEVKGQGIDDGKGRERSLGMLVASSPVASAIGQVCGYETKLSEKFTFKFHF